MLVSFLPAVAGHFESLPAPLFESSHPCAKLPTSVRNETLQALTSRGRPPSAVPASWRGVLPDTHPPNGIREASSTKLREVVTIKRVSLLAASAALSLLVSACTPTPSSGPSAHASRPSKAELAALVVQGPSGWTPQAFLSGPSVKPRDCLARPGTATYSGWLASATRSWRQNRTAPLPGFSAVPSIYVCLSLFSSPSAAENVVSQISSSYEAARHEPQPSSPTMSETVGGIPGASRRGGMIRRGRRTSGSRKVALSIGPSWLVRNTSRLGLMQSARPSPVGNTEGFPLLGQTFRPRLGAPRF